MSGEVNRLRRKITALEAQIVDLKANQRSREDSIKLAIIDRSPFTLWACDRNYRIVLWNKACVQVYGHPPETAIGAEFAQLFVDDVEAVQAREDCLKIIDHDVAFKNFLAYDHSKMGTRRTMLTNCFRVWDEGKREYLQAEVALEISDLQLRVEEHRNLRELGSALREQQKSLCKYKRDALLIQLTALENRLMRPVQNENRILDEYIMSLKNEKVSSERIDSLVSDKQKMLEQQTKDILSEIEKYRSRILGAQGPEELDQVGIDINQYDGTHLIRKG